MATLEFLKRRLRRVATEVAGSSVTRPLNELEYIHGFEILKGDAGWHTYRDFIIPELCRSIATLFIARDHISVLEIGPGYESVLEHLPIHLRQRITRYSAFEPKESFALALEKHLNSASSPFPRLDSHATIFRARFHPEEVETVLRRHGEAFNLILFCHSMCGMVDKHTDIEAALRLLVQQPEDGIVMVFHQDRLRIDGLVSHRTASFPTRAIRVMNNDYALDRFSLFIAGFGMKDVYMDIAIQAPWRKICRELGRRDQSCSNYLVFSAPETMLELVAQVPLAEDQRVIKNREASRRHPAAIVRPTEIRQVQKCVRWALKHNTRLTVLGGSHGGYCLQSNVVAVDMSNFTQIDIVGLVAKDGSGREVPCPLVVAEAGCTNGDIIRRTADVGLTVPLGARPSVGAGLWLQGGIGHLTGQHGLTCDAIVGAVTISVESGDILCLGEVPDVHQPRDSIRPDEEDELLWAIKGARTNFGIVISVTFKVYPAPKYSVLEWKIPLRNSLQAQDMLRDVDGHGNVSLPTNCSADMYLYGDDDRLYLGVTMIEASTGGPARVNDATALPMLGPEDTSEIVDSSGLFDTEMYVSEMHGSHGGGKTSSFKRCVFLKSIQGRDTAGILSTVVDIRPSPLCYLHLLHGGGQVGQVAASSSAFGCRDWTYACVITGVWPRDADDLLPMDLVSVSSGGVYSADLGPDPRDAALAIKAFGPNYRRLAHLKQRFDPHNVLAYACPLSRELLGHRLKLIIIVTGDHGVGKDYFASACATEIPQCMDAGLVVRVSSISDATKQEYAKILGSDLDGLRFDRAYKEHHRAALKAFFHDQVRLRPQLPEEHFLSLVHSARNADVLFITGMRDEAPVAKCSHLVPNIRMIDVHVTASKSTQLSRRGFHQNDVRGDNDIVETENTPDSSALSYCPTFIFENEVTGPSATRRFVSRYLLLLFREAWQQLSDMVRRVADFSRPKVEFHHVLGIAQHPHGLELCTVLLQSYTARDWTKVSSIVACEAGGFVFAAPLASQVPISLVLIREAGKLPPPTRPSHISSSAIGATVKEERIEMDRDAVPKGGSVVVVDDVLATGKTLVAVLELLGKAGVSVENISVLVVAEFTSHRGRELLRQRGFGRVHVGSLLVFGGM
ncbi:hypothetical protein F5Y15DRAFT_406372 [Xylariaceae sp. FL0016]|nr:hypothetical protein F5Y15DRAFT_406372 [Xylariaceae sp. FL0016]